MRQNLASAGAKQLLIGALATVGVFCSLGWLWSQMVPMRRKGAAKIRSGPVKRTKLDDEIAIVGTALAKPPPPPPPRQQQPPQPPLLSQLKPPTSMAPPLAPLAPPPLKKKKKTKGAVVNVEGVAQHEHMVADTAESGRALCTVFFAGWSRPCGDVRAAIVERLAERFGEACDFAMIDIEEEELDPLVSAHGVSKVPTFLVHKGAAIIDQLSHSDTSKSDGVAIISPLVAPSTTENDASGANGDGKKTADPCGLLDELLSVRLAGGGAPIERAAQFAGGCFWGLELALQRCPGVLRTECGYTQGGSSADTASPGYAAVKAGGTGHAEAVRAFYDEGAGPCVYEEVLAAFWRKIDPTQKDGQGNDKGAQYRTGVYVYPLPKQPAPTAAADVAPDALPLPPPLSQRAAALRSREAVKDGLDKPWLKVRVARARKCCMPPRGWLLSYRVFFTTHSVISKYCSSECCCTPRLVCVVQP